MRKEGKKTLVVNVMNNCFITFSKLKERIDETGKVESTNTMKNFCVDLLV